MLILGNSSGCKRYNGNFLEHLHVFDEKNCDKWVTQMKMIFGAQDVCDMMEICDEDLSGDASATQMKA